MGFPDGASVTPQVFNQEIVETAADPLFVTPKPKEASIPDPELSKAIQTRLDMKARGKSHQ